MGRTETRREIVLRGPLYLEPDAPLDWERVFGRRAPVLLDIGAARARLFLNVGPHLPEVDLVGIEVAKKRVERALELLEEHGLGGRARMIWANAVPVLRDYVRAESLAAVTVLYPDPWPKKRHAKRRIFAQRPVVDLIASRVAPGGLVLVKTDSAPYFAGMREAFGTSPLLRETDSLASEVPGFPAFSLDWPGETKYEADWKAEGRALYRVAYRRVSSDATPDAAPALPANPRHR